MKTLLSFVFILSLNNCYAATGNANDGILFVLSLILIMLLFLATGYFIDFLKSRIKEARTRRLLKRNTIVHEKDFINSREEAIPAFYGLSGL